MGRISVKMPEEIPGGFEDKKILSKIPREILGIILHKIPEQNLEEISEGILREIIEEILE